MIKNWIILNKLNTDYILSDILKTLLSNRNLKKVEEINNYFNPKLEDITIESLEIDRNEINKANNRIEKAIEKKENITVYSDYDVDGICSAAIVWEALYKLSAKILPYIPDRVNEGYGLSKKGIDFVKENHHSTLIITVDHGITAVSKITYAKKIGMDVIVIDHHVKATNIPPADAIIQTTKLCAAGLSLFFIDNLLNKIKKEKNYFKYFKKDLDLACLATIADLVPLIGPNRAIVKYGLESLNKTKRIGLVSLFKSVGLDKKKIGVYEISHIIAPRINALGRISHAIDALRLICTNDENKSVFLSEKLCKVNKDRQIMTEESFIHALETIKISDREDNNRKLIFLASESYKEGIIGLIAGKLVDKFYKPSIVVSVGKEYSKASARSVNGFNILETVRKVSHLLEDVGGHPMAAGFTLATKNLDKLRDSLYKIVDNEINDKKNIQALSIDVEINISDISFLLLETIKKLEPFGKENQEPVFVSRKVKVLDIRKIGKNGDHLKMILAYSDNFRTKNERKYTANFIEAVGFGMGDLFEKIFANSVLDIVYVIRSNQWNNKIQLQIKLIDVNILN